jgi:hypothetical protein
MTRMILAALVLLGVTPLAHAGEPQPAATEASAEVTDDYDKLDIDVDATPEAQLARLRAAIDSPEINVRARGCRGLAFSGITDEPLFDRIQAMVIEDYKETARIGHLVPEIPSCIRALASSGNPKYRELILDAPNRKPNHGMSWRWVQRHMQRSIEMYERFPEWNKVLVSTATRKPGEPWTLTQTRNMMQIPDALVQREALGRIRQLAKVNPEFYDLAENQLLLDYVQPVDHERLGLDLEFCKTLVEAHNAKYLPTLQRLAKDAVVEKLRIFAGRLLDKINKG